MTLLEKRLKARKEKRNYRLKVLVFLLVLSAIVASFYFSTAGKGMRYKKHKQYDDWSSFKGKPKRQ